MPREVIKALERGDHATALKVAIARWRRNRAPVIGDAIDAISSGANFDSPQAEDFHAMWLEIAAANDRRVRDAADPIAIGWLLETLGVKLDPAPRRRDDRIVTDLGERVYAVGRVAPDPRVATAMVRLLRPPQDAVMPWATFRPVLETIVEHADVRHVEHLRAVVAAPSPSRGRVRDGLRAWVPQYVDRLAEYVRAPVDDADVWRSLLPKTSASVPIDRLAGLLAAVHDGPDNDEARLVYADLLQTFGDPLGEFIALQMNPSEQTTDAMADRTQVLLERHRAEWLGPDLSAVLVDIVFERGFLADATLARHAVAADAVWALAARDVRLSTLHTLRTRRGADGHFAAFVASPELRGLRTLDLGTLNAIRALRPIERPTTVRHLQIRRTPSASWLREIAKLRALENVDRLSFPFDGGDMSELIRALKVTGLTSRLSELQIESPVPRENAIAELAATFETQDVGLARVRIVGADGSFELTRA